MTRLAVGVLLAVLGLGLWTYCYLTVSNRPLQGFGALAVCGGFLLFTWGFFLAHEALHRMNKETDSVEKP